MAEKARYHRGKSGNESARFQETAKPDGYVSSESIIDDDFDFSQGEEPSSDTDYVANSPSQHWTTTNTGGAKMEREILGQEGDVDMGAHQPVLLLTVRSIQSLRSSHKLLLFESLHFRKSTIYNQRIGSTAVIRQWVYAPPSL